MITEFLDYIRTPCNGHVRKMGYLKEAIAIEARYKRCSKSWAGHLKHSKLAILKAVETCEKKRKVVLLGTGALLDLPVKELSIAFDEVVLVDIVHPLSAIRLSRRFKNTKLIYRDITGTAEKIFINPAELPGPDAVFNEIDDSTDLVVSLNVLSQLPVILKKYAAGTGRFDDDRLDNWADSIIRSHYEALHSLKMPVCLITDYETIYKNKEGDVVENCSTIGTIKLPKPDKSWIWDIAPLGEQHKEISVHKKVAAIFF